MREGLQSVHARDLKFGDVISPTGKVVQRVAPSSQSGKVWVDWKDKRGTFRTGLWGARTPITIEER